MATKSYQAALELHQADQLDEAEKGYHEVLDEDPHNAEVLHLLGILHAQRQDFQVARYFLEQALAIKPYVATFHNSMGNVLRHLKEYDQAIYHYKKALHSQPDSAVAQNNLGNVFYQIDQLAEAGKHYREAIRLQPNYADAHYNLGLVLTRQDAIAAAIIELELTLKLQPQHQRAHYHLGYLLQMQQKLDVAAKHYQIALRLDMSDVSAHHNLGVILTNKGKYAAAIRHFKKVINLQPSNLDALNNLGTVFLLQNNPAAALKYFLRLAQLMRDFDVYYNLGVIYMDLGRYADAIVYLQEALTMRPNDFATHSNLGAIYLRREDYPNAELHYVAALAMAPDNQEIPYVLAAIRQTETPTAAPDKYIQTLFDQYAPYYEQHLQFLEYQVPQVLYEELIKIYGEPQQRLAILDLGCGTGICGAQIQGFAKTLIGVDLAPKMLALAEKKHIYTELKLISLSAALDYYRDLDLIVAADALVYFGDLATIFAKSKSALKANGILAFSIELTEDYPYHLQHTARYAHAKKYVDELVQQNNFTLVVGKEIVLRKQNNKPVIGLLYLIRG